VYFDFDSGNIAPAGEQHDDTPSQATAPTLPSAFVGDILERPAASAPIAPSFKANVGGFPAHKKRAPRMSAFKERRTNGGVQAQVQTKSSVQKEPAKQEQDTAKAKNVGFDQAEEKKQIDEENKQMLEGMSTAEIEQEQRELLESLSPSLIQRLLGRANLDEGSNEQDWEKQDISQKPTETKAPKKESSKKVAFVEQPDTSPPPPALQQAPEPASSEPQPPTEPTQPSPQADLAADVAAEDGTLHFPRPTQPPDLDPNDPSFLSSLHEKYFPNLAYDPSTLSWMTPIDPSDTTSAYHPSHTAFHAKDLRFDFKGALLAPSVAREIPVSKGLHHHADAPEAAGYTIPELGVMARSAVAAQRCVAYRTLGRILYRLGKGEFGYEKLRRRDGGDGPVQVVRNPGDEGEVDEEDVEVDMEDAGSAMAAGLWNCVEEARVIDTLTEEAKRTKGHLSARSFAEEALWNWRRGGGRKRLAV